MVHWSIDWFWLYLCSCQSFGGWFWIGFDEPRGVYTVFSPSSHHHKSLLSPGCAVCLPGAWFSDSDAAGEQPHVPTVQDRTCPEGGAMEGCALPGLWASGKQNDRDHLPANDNDYWWKERFGRRSFIRRSVLCEVDLIVLHFSFRHQFLFTSLMDQAWSSNSKELLSPPRWRILLCVNCLQRLSTQWCSACTTGFPRNNSKTHTIQCCILHTLKNTASAHNMRQAKI